MVMEYDEGVAAMTATFAGRLGYRQVASVTGMATEVRDNPDRSRYEILVDGEVAGFTDYRRRDGRITFTHTEVDDAHEGEGLGSTLVRHGLDAARDAGLAVFPSCPFTAEWIRHHPEYVELVPENAREAYDLA
jgi:predicted GNAT family acetyltransferase